MGIEYAFLPNWSAKIEYDFIDFGTKLYNFPVTSTAVSASNFANWNFTAMVHEMKLGVNYHFRYRRPLSGRDGSIHPGGCAGPQGPARSFPALCLRPDWR